MQPMPDEVEAVLLRGYFNPRTHGFCNELWEHREHLWTFLASEAWNRPTTPRSARCSMPSSGAGLSARPAIGLGQPVRRAHADRDRDLPTSGPQRRHLADRGRPGQAERATYFFAAERRVNGYCLAGCFR